MLSAAGVLVAAALVAGITAPLATAGPEPSGSETIVSNFELNARADAPAKAAPTADPTTPELRFTDSPLASDDPVVPIAPPVQCPEGTLPGVVDLYGNESDCQPMGG